MKHWVWFFVVAFNFTAYGQVSDSAHNPPHWMVWQVQNSPIPFNYVTDIAIAEDGKKWVSFCEIFGLSGTTGVARFDSADWRSWKLGPATECITTIAQGYRDTAYYSILGNSFSIPLSRTTVNQVEAVYNCVDPAWFTDMRYKNGKLELLSNNLIIHTPPDECIKYDLGPLHKWSIYWDVSGWYLIGTYGKGILKFNGVDSSTLPIFIDGVDLGSSYINAIAIEPDAAASTGLGGNLWFSFYWSTRNESLSGIGIWDGQKVQVIRKETMGTLSNLVYHIKRNPLDGSMWVGSQDGLARYHQGQWSAFNFGTGFMVGNEITAIEIDALGNTWIGTNNGLIAYNDQGVVFSKRPISKPAQPLKVFPNPAQEQTTLELWTESATQATISIHNLSGKLLRQEVWNIAEGGLHQYSLALTGLAQGMYVVMVHDKTKQNFARIVRQ